jgi:hypothetical protein
MVFDLDEGAILVGCQWCSEHVQISLSLHSAGLGFRPAH